MGRNGDPDKPVEPEKAREHGNNLGAVRVRGGEPEAGTETDGQSMNPKVTNVRTSDRVANPWSERTPSGQDEDWPIRVDQFLVDVISEDDVDCWVQTASILHSNGDVLDMAVKDGRIAGVRGRAVDRVNKGRVGPKDLFGWQANNSEDRLTRPLVRKNGELVETS